MAVKDHSLDDKITEAAKGEFLRLGFQKASLRKIAQLAGITTGALYTRYKNKDILFQSLIKDVFSRIAAEFGPLEAMYLKARESGSAQELMRVIRLEEQVYLDLMFDCYDECVLFICRSGGSSVEQTMNTLMEKKIQDTVDFLRGIAKKDVDFDGVAIIMSNQFSYYRQILERGYSKEKALSCMKTVEAFLEAGFKDLFEKIM